MAHPGARQELHVLHNAHTCPVPSRMTKSASSLYDSIVAKAHDLAGTAPDTAPRTYKLLLNHDANRQGHPSTRQLDDLMARGVTHINVSSKEGSEGVALQHELAAMADDWAHDTAEVNAARVVAVIDSGATNVSSQVARLRELGVVVVYLHRGQSTRGFLDSLQTPALRGVAPRHSACWEELVGVPNMQDADRRPRHPSQPRPHPQPSDFVPVSGWKVQLLNSPAGQAFRQRFEDEMNARHSGQRVALNLRGRQLQVVLRSHPSIQNRSLLPQITDKLRQLLGQWRSMLLHLPSNVTHDTVFNDEVKARLAEEGGHVFHNRNRTLQLRTPPGTSSDAALAMAQQLCAGKAAVTITGVSPLPCASGAEGALWRCIGCDNRDASTLQQLATSTAGQASCFLYESVQHVLTQAGQPVYKEATLSVVGPDMATTTRVKDYIQGIISAAEGDVAAAGPSVDASVTCFYCETTVPAHNAVTCSAEADHHLCATCVRDQVDDILSRALGGDTEEAAAELPLRCAMCEDAGSGADGTMPNGEVAAMLAEGSLGSFQALVDLREVANPDDDGDDADDEAALHDDDDDEEAASAPDMEAKGADDEPPAAAHAPVEHTIGGTAVSPAAHDVPQTPDDPRLSTIKAQVQEAQQQLQELRDVMSWQVDEVLQYVRDTLNATDACPMCTAPIEGHGSGAYTCPMCRSVLCRWSLQVTGAPPSTDTPAAQARAQHIAAVQAAEECATACAAQYGKTAQDDPAPAMHAMRRQKVMEAFQAFCDGRFVLNLALEACADDLLAHGLSLTLEDFPRQPRGGQAHAGHK